MSTYPRDPRRREPLYSGEYRLPAADLRRRLELERFLREPELDLRRLIDEGAVDDLLDSQTGTDD
jgi:hypothetical protein